MAKRKRLTPANPVYLEPAPEQKSAITAPPIADVAREASATAAAAELAQTLTDARANGRMVITVPLADVMLDYLVRDRVVVDGDEMEALKSSLRHRGQQTPIELVELEQGRYGLISGWRRCTALAALQQDTGDVRFGTVLALLRRPADSVAAYQAMVDENEIRVGLSYYERARIVCKAVEQGVFETKRAALQGLFASASRPRRSKIGSFVGIVQALDGALKFPHLLGERLGLALARALTDDPALTAHLGAALQKADVQTAEAEQAVIDRVLKAVAPAPGQTATGTATETQTGTLAPTPAEGEPQPAPNSPPDTPPDNPPDNRPDNRPRRARLVVGGVSLQADGNRITLEGRRVDADLAAKLTEWLRATF